MAEHRRRLGLYCPGVGTGGPWRYVHSLLAAIDPGEFDVTLFCHLTGGYGPRPQVDVVNLSDCEGAGAGGGDRPPEAAPPARAWARALVPRPLKVPAGFAGEARRLARRLGAHPVDLLHTQATGCEESPVAARLAGVPRVLGTFHVDSTYDLAGVRSGLPYRALERLSNRSLHRAIAVSEATKADWVRRTGIDPGRVRTIPNGVDPDRFRRRRGRREARELLGLPGGDRVVIGGVGRLEEAKGFGDLVEAAAILAPDHPGLLVAIAGEGPLRDPLLARARALGVADRVVLLGQRADVPLVLEALDVFALPSLCEAMPYALLEASAMGLPAVGAAVGGVPEVIAAGRTGLLVPPRDPGALAAALRPLVGSAELREAMGRAGRGRMVEHFDESRSTGQTIEVYREMLRTPRAG